MSKSKDLVPPDPDRTELIKRLTIISMFSDDELMDRLVLKGGNALDIVHRVSTRASLDVDFSIEGDWKQEELNDIRARIERSLRRTFKDARFVVFDVQMTRRPPNLTPDVADFWGGHLVEFKALEEDDFAAHRASIEALRRRAGRKLSIDISSFEYTQGKQARELDGYQIFVYSAEMLVCEKLRAICQQMPEYGEIVKRARPGGARARDFATFMRWSRSLGSRWPRRPTAGSCEIFSRPSASP